MYNSCVCTSKVIPKEELASKFQSSETPPTSLISDLLINVDVVVPINNCLETQLTIQSSVGGIKYREIPVDSSLPGYIICYDTDTAVQVVVR